MGILLKLWLWALDNANKTGELLNADRDDVARLYIGSTSAKAKPERVVELLISEGWINELGGNLFIHDWPEWQRYWFDFQERREKDRTRKKRGNSEEKEQDIPQKFQGNSMEHPQNLHGKSAEIPVQSESNRNLIKSDLNQTDTEANALCPASQTTSDAISEIIAFLNLTVGANYKSTTEKTRRLISTRLKEGFSVDDFKTVILKKHSEWSANPDMSKYLRPETLFGTKFESYLNQPDRSAPQSVRGALEKLYHQEKEAGYYDET